jgi:hypothetical protein
MNSGRIIHETILKETEHTRRPLYSFFSELEQILNQSQHQGCPCSRCQKLRKFSVILNRIQREILNFGEDDLPK